MSDLNSTPIANQLLANLPDLEYQRLVPYLKSFDLKLNDILFRPGDTINYVYFPLHGVVSLLTEVDDNTGIEVGMVGHEGMAGIDVILGVQQSSKTGTVQVNGEALRMPADVLQAEFKRGGQLQTLLLRYTHALMSQISQTAACNRRHPLEGRLARWLLMSRDRVETDGLPLTHEFLGNMLGSRRAGVTLAIGELEGSGLIRGGRGRITIIDREGLEEKACDCYQIVNKEFQQLYQ